jgi:hypothetical protein
MRNIKDAVSQYQTKNGNEILLIPFRVLASQKKQTKIFFKAKRL